jgi:lysophospholipase L1-like esterase/chitodextrinase
MTISAARARRALAGLVALWGIGFLTPSLPGAWPACLRLTARLEASGPAADAAGSGPFVSLPLNEGAGSIASDVSGNGNNGALLNGSSWTTGKSGPALSFDGVDDTVFVATSSTLNSATTGITVAAWVYRAANQTGVVSVVSRQLGNTYYEHFYLGFENGKYRWFVNTSSGYSDATLGGSAPLGQWIFLVGTYNGTDVKLYANGVLQFSTPHSGALAGDVTGITIGASYNDAAHTAVEPFNGKIDEVNIYGQALTAAEVSQAYHAAGGTLDGPPSVSIISPAAGGTVQGTFTATATAVDDVGIAGVQFLVDGSPASNEDTSAPFSGAIETFRYSEGSHTLTAVGRDTAGNLASSPGLPVVFDNIAIIPMGDSLTYGYVNDGNPENEVGGYRRYLWGKLLANGISNLNFVGSLVNGISSIDRDHEGHGGWRIDEIDAAVGGWLNSSQPDIILLFAGSNDIIQGYTPSQALNRMGLLLDKIHNLRPAARVIVANLTGARANQDSVFAKVTPAAVAEFNSGLAPLVNNRAGQGWNVELMDAFGSAGIDRSGNSPDYSIDGLHLSLAGYSKLADLWYSTLNLPTADATAPTVPTGLTALPASATQINLSWNASTDNVGVAGYRVFRNGVALATTSSTAYQDGGLAADMSYYYSVQAYDSASNQSSISAAVSATTGAAPRITGFSWNVNFPAPPGVPITFTAVATGGGAVEYRFLTYSTATGWVVMREYSGANAFTWFPPLGENAVQVWVRSAGSTAPYQDWTGSGVFNVVASAPKLTGLASNVTFPASPLTTQTWTATASGGSGALEYKFLHYSMAANSWTVMRDWSTSNQVSWAPGASNSGWHSLQVWVRTVGSNAGWEDWRGTDYFLVSTAPTISLTPSRPLSGLKLGDLITWTATLSGGGPWEYQFLTFDGTTWRLTQPYSTQNTFSWFPPANTCALQVWVRAVGSSAYWELYTGASFVVAQ